MIEQGDVYWLDLGDPVGSELTGRRPYVVVQNNLFNSTAISTVLICPITGTLRLARQPGNVEVRAGEANLPRTSVVNVSQVFAVDRSHLDEWIGRLSPARARQIVDGIRLFIEPRDP